MKIQIRQVNRIKKLLKSQEKTAGMKRYVTQVKIKSIYLAEQKPDFEHRKFRYVRRIKKYPP